MKIVIIIKMTSIKVTSLNKEYTWSDSKSFYYNKAMLWVYESKMGCGLLQIYGIAGISPESLEDYQAILKQVVETYKNDSCVFICTLGKQWFKKEEFLFKLGFKLLQEYPNKRHGGGYTQRLYIYIAE